MSCCDNPVKSYLTKNRYDLSCCAGVSGEVHTTTYWRPGAIILEGPTETSDCIQRKSCNKKKVNRYVLDNSGERISSGSLKSNLSYAEYLRKRNKSIEQVVRRSVGKDISNVTDCSSYNCIKYITTKNNKNFFKQGAVSSSTRMERLKMKNLNKSLSSCTNCDYAVRGAHLKDKTRGKNSLWNFTGCAPRIRTGPNNQRRLNCPE